MSATGQIARTHTFDLVVLLTSLGGLQAVSTVLAGLPAQLEMPVVMFQHRHQHPEDGLLPSILQRSSPLPVRATVSGDAIDQPGVSVLPAGQTAVIDADRCFQLRDAPRGGGGDQLLDSASGVLGSAVLGVILTGALNDGAAGSRSVKTAGGRILAQDPTTARAAGMPSAAIATGCVDLVLPLSRLASAITALTMAPGGADLLAVPTAPWAQLGPRLHTRD